MATLISLAKTKLAGLLEVRKLIQGLIHGAIDPETFTAKLQTESYLSTDESKSLIPFLKSSLRLFQIAFLKGELSIDGLKPLHPNRSLGMNTENTKLRRITGNTSITDGSKVTGNLPTKADFKVENVPINNVMDVFKPDGNNMVQCKSCNANCKDISKHLTKTRKSIRCESRYSSAQLSALYNEGAKSIGKYDNKELTENGKAEEVTKIGQISSSMEIRIESAKAFKEAKTRALTLANETWNSDIAKHSCNNFLATLLCLARTKLTGLEVPKLIQDLIDGAIDPDP